MLSFVRHHVSVAGCFARLAIQRQLEYPLFLVSWFLMIPTQYFAGIWMLKIIVDRFQPLNGWSFEQLAFVYGLGLLSHGLQVIFFIQTWNIEGMVIRGGFDRMLLRPMNVFFQFVVNYVNFIGMIDLIPGSIIFLYACSKVGFAWTLSNILKLLAVILGGMLIRAAIYTITGSIAFWTKASRSMVGLVGQLFERTGMYPLSIYPVMVQMLLTFLVPVGFISFYPACEFLKQDDRFILPLGLAIWTPVVGVLMFSVAHAIFKLGLSRYESAGS
jgi:ABC-2 type transport system permease protein